MADWSPEHNKYLSALLDDVTGSEEGVRIRQDFCKIHDCIMWINPHNANVYYTGSKAEGLDLPGSDRDYMYDINDLYNIEVSESLHDLIRSTRRNKLLIVTDNVPPAFATLKCVTLQDPLLFLSAVHMNNEWYLSSQQFVSSPWLQSEKTDTSRIQGPSVETWSEYDDTSQSGQDNVPSIVCKFWPTSADEWKDRPRHYGWPSQRDKEYIEQFGCHLVPVGHPLSARKSLEWRLSFSIAERTLAWSFNHTQLQCYAVMKVILKEYVKTKCAEKYKSVLCSYFIKTFLFWQIEKMDRSFWQIANLSGCIIFLFREFYSCIQTGVLRHYFVSRFNLLEINLTPDAQTELLKIFGKVIEAGISVIGQCSSLVGVCSHFFEIRDRRHCAERTTNLRKRFLLINDEITMTFISLEMLELIYRKLLPYESIFAAFVRLYAEGNVQTSLSVFFIRRFGLMIATRKLYNSVHQCNKYVHYHMTLLSRNVYGTDIGTSKLWLGTFLLQQGDYDGSLQNVNNVLSSIPPYALYNSGLSIKSSEDSKQLYIDRYCGRNTDILCKAEEAWLFDMHITQSEYSFVPRAIQIEFDHCDPRTGVNISPFTYANYLMFLCYHGLGQYDNRDRALRQLVDTVNDRERRCVCIEHSYNITGHCMLMAGNVDMARIMFLISARFTHQVPVLDKYNAAYKYLSLLWSNKSYYRGMYNVWSNWTFEIPWNILELRSIHITTITFSNFQSHKAGVLDTRRYKPVYSYNVSYC